MENQQTQMPVAGHTPGSWKLMPNVGQLFSEAWEQLSKHFGIYIFVLAAPMLLFIALMIGTLGVSFVTSPTPNFENFTPSISLAIGFAIAILVLIIFSIWSTSSLTYAISHSKENLTIGQVYRKGWEKFGSYFWINFLIFLIVLGSMSLLGIPAIMFSMWFLFAPFILMIEGDRGFTAMMKSREYIRGYWWSVFGRYLLLLAISIGLNIIFSVLGAILQYTNSTSAFAGLQLISYLISMIAGAFTLIYVYRMYEQLKTMKGVVTVPPAGTNSDKTLIIVLTIIGYVAWMAMFFGVIMLIGLAAD